MFLSFISAIPIQAEGNLIGFINNYEIREAKFSANMVPLPDNSATHVNATIRNVPSELGKFKSNQNLYIIQDIIIITG